jgi:DNA/RNA endonuclease YhcR with UshA esterase domain
MPSPTPQPPVRTTGQITQADVGQVYTLRGVSISEVWWSSGGASYRVNDGQGSIVLFIYQDEYETLPLSVRHEMVPGTVLDVVGTIDEYQGTLEVIPRCQDDLRIVVVGEHHPLEQRPIADIRPADEGRWLTVDATIETVTTFSAGIKLVVNDGSGTITLLLWQNIYERVPGKERLVPGVQIRATGAFGIEADWGNEFRIVPCAGSDVEVY